MRSILFSAVGLAMLIALVIGIAQFHVPEPAGEAVVSGGDIQPRAPSLSGGTSPDASIAEDEPEAGSAVTASGDDTGSGKTRRPVHRPGIDSLLLYPPPGGPLDVGQAHDLVLAAEAGEPVAQTSLGRMLRHCSRSLKGYGTPLEFDDARAHYEANQVGGLTPQHWDNLRQDLQNCWALAEAYDIEEATAAAWFARAARQGYGPALSDLAIERLVFNVQMVDGREQVVSDEPAARVLFNAAMQTRHPQALFQIGIHHGNSDLFPARRYDGALSWILAACRFGLHCGSDSEWLRAMCRVQGDCDRSYAVSLLDYVGYNMFTGRERDFAHENAPELIGLLESGDWQRLDLRMGDEPSLEEILAGIEG